MKAFIDAHRAEAKYAQELSVSPDLFDGNVEEGQENPVLGATLQASERAADTTLRDEILAANEAQFRKTWHSSRTPPRLNAINTVRRGETVSALLIFHGCTPAATGACEVVSSFIIEGPDGGRTPGGGGPVWTEAPARPGLLQLGQAGMSVVFDPSDPVGDYRIIANIEDRVSGRVLSVWLV